MKAKVSALLSLLGAACTCAAANRPFVLAERGKAPECAIVVESTEPSFAYAAEELRDWTKRLVGVRLPIATNEASASGFRRTVRLSGRFDANLGLGTDGFRLKTDGGSLIVQGGCRGILYGVYEILETFGGIGWYASWRTVVPEADRFEVPGDLDDVQKPTFFLRGRGWFDLRANPDFSCRLRLNGGRPNPDSELEDRHGGTAWRQSGGGHSLARLVPAWKYGESHPEYFAEIDGVRRTRNVQPCLTNPDVLEIVTSNLFEIVRNDPTAQCYDVTQNDYDNYCTCKTCKAVDEEEGAHAGTMIRFVNAVAERVEKAFPGKQVCTFAYRYTRKPPLKVRPRKNVVVKLCPIECDYSAPINESLYKENVKFEQDIRKWSEISHSLYLFDYVTNFRDYLHTFPNAPVLFANLRRFRDAGVAYYGPLGNSEGRHSDFAELKAWLLAKGMWNPDRPWRPLAEKFMKGYYGAAAPYAMECFDVLNAAPSDSRNKPALIYEDAWDKKRVSDEMLYRAEKIWQKAIAAVKNDPECLYNVRMSAAGVTYSLLSRMMLNMKTAWVTRSPENFRPDPRLHEMLDRMASYEKEAKGLLRYREHGYRNKEVLERMAAARNCRPGAPADSVTIKAEQLEFQERRKGQYGRRIGDKDSIGGKAIAVYSKDYGWKVKYFFRDLAFDKGVKYRVRVHMRAEKTGNPGEAFAAGLYDKNQKKQNIVWKRFDVSSMPDGYAWYDVGVLTPTDTSMVWIATARPSAMPAATKEIIVDAIEISRVAE